MLDLQHPVRRGRNARRPSVFPPGRADGGKGGAVIALTPSQILAKSPGHPTWAPECLPECGLAGRLLLCCKPLLDVLTAFLDGEQADATEDLAVAPPTSGHSEGVRGADTPGRHVVHRGRWLVTVGAARQVPTLKLVEARHDEPPGGYWMGRGEKRTPMGVGAEISAWEYQCQGWSERLSWSVSVEESVPVVHLGSSLVEQS